MKMYIPENGDIIVLSNDWTFTMMVEYRNADFLINSLGYRKSSENPINKYDGEWIKNEFYFEQKNDYGYNDKFYTVTLPAGTVLTIDRVYIRKGCSDYSSITFFIKDCVLFKNKKGKKRFWAKLRDVNNIEFTHLNVKTTSIVWKYNNRTWYSSNEIVGTVDGVERFKGIHIENTYKYQLVDLLTNTILKEDCKDERTLKTFAKKYLEKEVGL